MPPVPQLRWRRTAVLAALLALTFFGAMLTVAQIGRTTVPGKRLDRGALVDLSEREVRQRMSWIADRQRSHLGNRASLLLSCDAGSPETYVAQGFRAFRRPESEEVLIERHAADRGATAWGASTSIPPPPPEPGSAPEQPPPPVRQYELAADDIDTIESEVLALRDAGAKTISGQAGLDGQFLLVEYCHGGRYGLFAYFNPDLRKPQEERMLNLANRILTAGGAKPLEGSFSVDLP